MKNFVVYLTFYPNAKAHTLALLTTRELKPIECTSFSDASTRFCCVVRAEDAFSAKRWGDTQHEILNPYPEVVVPKRIEEDIFGTD